MEKTEQKKKRIFKGTVISTAMSKTIVVQVDRMKLNTKYNKYYKINKKYHVHDEAGLAKVGNVVSFAECRPISRTKRWYLLEVLK